VVIDVHGTIFAVIMFAGARLVGMVAGRFIFKEGDGAGGKSQRQCSHEQH
jgi:hypothetical protein